MRRRVVVSALISYNDRYLFMTQCKEGGIFPDTIHLPGGGLLAGERCEDALRREIREETGLELIEVQRFDFEDAVTMYRGRKCHFVFLRYTAISKTDNAIPHSDAKELFWLTREEIPNYPHNPVSLTFLRKLGLL